MDLLKAMGQLIDAIVEKLASGGGAAGGAVSAHDRGISEKLETVEATVRSAFERDLAELRAYTSLNPLTGPSVELAARLFQLSQLERISGQKPGAAALDDTVAEAKSELPARAARWHRTQEALGQVPELIALVKRIPGWQGNASGQYANASTRQGSASQELAVVASRIPATIGKVLSGNELAVRQVLTQLSRVGIEVRSAHGAPWSLPRTRAAASVLGKVGVAVTDARSGRLTQGITSKIDSQARSLSQQLHPWPTT